MTDQTIAPASTTGPRATSVPPPLTRKLRAYAFDPSVSTQMQTAVINRVVIEVPWERTLGVGPVGEYLEVVDYDPASGCFYEPVDLNNPYLLAQDGLEPSEGNPQFHQQMAYAVAMTTIGNFERALGRLALWSPRPYDRATGRREQYVQRLRVYPHALREANAYYSPQKKALLFGYFPASYDDPGTHLGGGTVFTCLSHDVIAHETTHALLDGIHRRFQEPSNPDVLAFHEAFADIVALFQHFSYPDVLRHQIGRTRGDLASQSLLGELAQEFGQATGRYGALRDALGEVDPQTRQWTPRAPDPELIERTFEPHARGALLVAAVFDAFLSIYRSRVGDLLRIATQGSGILPAGDLHPDLANRLAMEASRSAQHVLNMAIRALDYCPPTDITFGEYLRALITADYDLVPNDDRHYRIAVLEAFRRRGIYPREVRSLSEDSLRWQEPHVRDNQPISLALPDDLAQEAQEWNMLTDRETIFRKIARQRQRLHAWLFPEAGGRLTDDEQRQMGLDLQAPDAVVEIHSLRPTRRIGPDGQTVTDLIVEITQQRPMALDAADQAEVASAKREKDFAFRGGCTLIIDIGKRAGTIRYCIAKNIRSERRLAAQRRFYQHTYGNALRATYFGNPLLEANAEPFALLHRSTAEEEPL